MNDVIWNWAPGEFYGWLWIAGIICFDDFSGVIYSSAWDGALKREAEDDFCWW